nr:hypothetical protein Iba_chr09dCG4000 [Ipomoea batatas]
MGNGGPDYKLLETSGIGMKLPKPQKQKHTNALEPRSFNGIQNTTTYSTHSLCISGERNNNFESQAPAGGSSFPPVTLFSPYLNTNTD